MERHQNAVATAWPANDKYRLNDEEPFFEPLPAHSRILTSRKAATMDAKKRQSAGLLVFMAAILFATAKITNPGYNRVLNQQKAAHKEQKRWLRRKTNFVLFVVFYSAL